MRVLKLSMVALIAIGNFGYAGGDISPVTRYETGDMAVADEEAVPEYVAPAPVTTSDEDFVSEPEEESTVEEYVAPTPEATPVTEYVEPAPIATPVPTPISTPAPTPPPVVKTKPTTSGGGFSANGLYVGLGITGVRYKDSCHCKKNVKVTNKDTTYGIVGRVGYDFNKYLGVEARASKTNWKSDGSKVEHMGVYAKPMLPISDNANIYGLVGMAKTKVKGSMPHLEHDGLAVGGGVELNLSKDKGLGVFVDYERMVAKTHAPRLHAVSAGVTYDF